MLKMAYTMDVLHLAGDLCSDGQHMSSVGMVFKQCGTKGLTPLLSEKSVT